jgi:large subunit ribosomal protein L4
MILDSLTFEAPRTKGFIALLQTLGITGSVLFVTDNLDRNAFLSGRNLQSVDMLPAMGVDVLSVLKHDWLVLTRAAAAYLETTLA